MVETVIEEKNENLLLDRAYALKENNYGRSAAFYKCTWFYNNKYEHEMFPEEMLDARLKKQCRDVSI